MYYKRKSLISNSFLIIECKLRRMLKHKSKLSKILKDFILYLYYRSIKNINNIATIIKTYVNYLHIKYY